MPSLWKRADKLGPAFAAVLDLGRGEKVLAHARDEGSGSLVAATTHSVMVLADGPDGAERLLARPWHTVDAGSWDGELSTLTMSWADGSPSLRWRFSEATVLLTVVRERVQASVVVADELILPNRRKVRLALRQNLATGEIVEQTITRRPMDLRDPQAKAQVEARLAALRASIGR